MTTDSVNIRELALEILLSVTKGEEYSHIAINAVLEKYQYLSKQERAFLTRLTEGTLENGIELDYIINQFSKVKVNKMKPVIRCILRMGVYQLKYMDSVPASAACNEAVKLAERKGFRNLKGFVNGVLRNISRNSENISYPNEETEPLYALSIRTSVPVWILEQWNEDYGFEKAKAIANAFRKTENGTTIRTNLKMQTPQELKEMLLKRDISVKEISLPEFPKLDYAMEISNYDYLRQIPEFSEGRFVVQDISSMLVAEVAEPKKGDYVIDVCAAPGGKSIHIADKLCGTGMVEARDLTFYKTDKIEENIKRLGVTNVRARCADARVTDEEAVEKADIVIADLPCSGLGVLRKKPEIRYRMTKEQEKELALLQREILSVVCRYVKAGGVLMYSTCTLDKTENEENTAWFLSEHSEFSLEYERQIFPDEGGRDGFYIAKLRRKL